MLGLAGLFGGTRLGSFLLVGFAVFVFNFEWDNVAQLSLADHGVHWSKKETTKCNTMISELRRW